MSEEGSSPFATIEQAPPDPILGLTEAFNADREAFGTARLEAALQTGRSASATDLVAGVLAATLAFAAGAEQSDDITCLALAWRP